jgi:hypothetical protein
VSSLALGESDAQAVILARAFEEADPDGVLLSADVRQAATEAARDGATPQAQAARRAWQLLAALEAKVPALAAVRRATRLPVRALVPIWLAAFILGALSNELGPERHINVLSFPLFGILLWNLCVYAVVVVAALLGLAHRRREHGSTELEAPPAAAGERSWRGTIGAIASWIAEHSLRRVRLPDAPRTTIAAHALRDYWRVWSRLVARLVGERIKLALHVGAAVLVLGAVAGMYVRGLTFEYRATWESTFVGPTVAAWLLHLVLGPAAAVFGFSLPGAAELEAMRAPGDAPAALWIHLWAATAALVVLMPRSVLALAAYAKQRKLARQIDVDPLGGSFRVLLAPDRGAGLAVDVLPYSYGLAGRAADTLRELLHDVFGLRADVQIHAALPYGVDLDDAMPAAPANGAGNHHAAACSVLVYGLVQSPEREVHGRFAQELLARHDSAARVLAVVDSSAWHARFVEGDARREGERRRAWDRVLAEVGLTPLHLDLGAALTTDVVEQVEARLGRARAAVR